MTRRFVSLLALPAAAVSAFAASAGCQTTATPPPAPAAAPQWQLLASELPSALLSVSGRAADDVYAVGADKGQGPLVLHFDGKGWKAVKTGVTGDLWWVQAHADCRALMGGGSASVLRFAGGRFERLPTPGLGKQTVYGVWGKTADDFYAVGSAAGRDGFVWRYHDGRFDSETLPLELPRMPGGEVPGFFKVWGAGDDVWVVGAAGAIMHRKGSGPFAVVPSGTKDTIFTVHGTGDRLLAVGGAGNGVLLQGPSPLHDSAPTGMASSRASSRATSTATG